MKAVKVSGLNWSNYAGTPGYAGGQAFNDTAVRAMRELGDGIKAGDRNKARADGGHEWTTTFEEAGIKNTGGSWFNIAHNTTSGHGQNPDGRKAGGSFGRSRDSDVRNNSSKSLARKAASARIAKIPAALAQYIARTFKDDVRRGVA